ncbi:MAG: hypothetical protein WC406_09540, partial [Methanoregula sp.]
TRPLLLTCWSPHTIGVSAFIAVQQPMEPGGCCERGTLFVLWSVVGNCRGLSAFAPYGVYEPSAGRLARASSLPAQKNDRASALILLIRLH